MFLLERNLGATLSGLILQSYGLDDERTHALITGIIDPRVGEVLDEFLEEYLVE